MYDTILYGYCPPSRCPCFSDDLVDFRFIRTLSIGNREEVSRRPRRSIWLGRRGVALAVLLVAFALLVTGILLNRGGGLEILPRASRIPKDAVKITPLTDAFPPKLHSRLYEDPVPMQGPINTAGAEDSPFILPCGCTFYFVFVPDVGVPPEKQLVDGVTGIYESKKVNGAWSEPKRVVLNSDVSLDGCQFIQDDVMWFCSARKGNYREVDLYTERLVDGEWADWKNAGEKLNAAYQVGEIHVTADGNEMYFHSSRAGGKGGVDIWVTRRIGDEWQIPENVEAVNTEADEGMPFITENGDQLWFNRVYLGSQAIYVSRKINGEWREPELVVSQFAGEPTLDAQGNLYFVHHLYKNNKMIEADIYVAYRKETMKGVSLSPRGYQQSDFLDFLAKSKQAGSIVTWAGDWNELTKTNGSAPKILTQLSSTYGFVPVVEVTPHSDGFLLRPLDNTTKQSYLDSAVAFAEEYRPAYLGLGVETNVLYENSPVDFDGFVDLYNEVYDAVKSVSPSTKIFTTFQLEELKGYTLWSNEPANPQKAQWGLLDRFKTDLWAFTTYPGLVFKDPSEIPENYYAEIAVHTTKPIAFTEIGWHSEASPLGWESSEAEQARFVDRFFFLTEELCPEITVWSFLYDPQTIEPFRSMGLIKDDGTPRQAMASWTQTRS